MFARNSLQGMSKDVLYDTLNREDLNWRKCHELIAYKTVISFRRDIKKAFVVDDSVKQLFGKNMSGISSIYFNIKTPRGQTLFVRLVRLKRSCPMYFPRDLIYVLYLIFE